MRRLLHSSIWQVAPALLALLLLAGVFFVYVLLEQRVNAANQRRLDSLQLIDVLRQSSDDLTRMARSMVATGDARYRRAFDEIGAIRDGRSPWPEGYEGVYWDLVLVDGRAAGRPGRREPLLQRMKSVGFTSTEFERLEQAKRVSDALMQIELRAMALAESGEREAALALLHDAEYHRMKASIMAPIDEVLDTVQQRTGRAVDNAMWQAAWARWSFIGLALLLALLLLRTRHRMWRLMGGAVQEVHARITQIGRGDFSAPQPARPVPEASVLGRLLQTQLQLQQSALEREQSQQRQQLAAGVFTHAREGIMITDDQGLIVDVNAAFTRLTGYTREEVLGQSPRLLDSGRHPPEFYDQMMATLQQADQWQGEVWDRRRNGEVFATLETISAVRDARGRITHYVTLMSDITAMKEQAQRLEHIAHYDALTALPNRVLLGDRLKQAMSMAPRHGRRVALVYLDLDGFKAVNDQQGHEAGDRLLVELATRLRQVLREGDTLARLGGDEFVAVLLDLPDVTTCHALLQRMLREIAQPFQLAEGQTVQVSGSLGVSYFPQRESVDADQLLRQADQAMYQAKLAGKNRFHEFDDEEAAQLRGQLEIVAGLREALAQGQLLLYYQPKVNLRSGAVIGVEALLRWQHPQQGLLAPGAFLGMVEDHPLICEIGDWVIEQALAQLAAWRGQGLRLELSVNVSARQLQQPDFSGRVLAALQRHRVLRAQDLHLEVLETSALEDLVGVSRTMAEGSARGLRFSLDDFGTGYSSLTYLRRLPVAQLKIDQSFVRDMLDDADDLAILDGVIGLAAAFRREVIAEGVETAEHGAVLLQLGCELAQGFGIAAPMPAAALPAWVAAWQPPAAWRGMAVVSREQLPLLRAGLDQRARSRALLRYLQGQREQAPSLAARDCRLIEWLDGPQGSLARYAPLREQHGETLAMAWSLVQARARGESLDAALLEQYQAAEAQLQRLLQLQLQRE